MHPILRGLIIGFCLVLLNGVVRGELSISGFFELKKTFEILDKRVENLKAENEAIETEIARIKNSPAYARKVLKDKYHETEEGETMIMIKN